MDRVSLRRPSLFVVIASAVLAVVVAVAVIAFVHDRPGSRNRPTFTLGQALLAVNHGDPIYLQYTGVTGAASSVDHTKHTQILSFQLKVSRTITDPSPVAGRLVSPPQRTDACLTKREDKYSAGLFNASLLGTPKDAILYFTKIGVAPYEEYMRIEMQDVLISSWHWNSGGDVPTESFCLNFTKLIITFEPIGQPRQVQTWDFVANAPLPVG
jgi:type VI secretion system secreted protein Hcp